MRHAVTPRRRWTAAILVLAALIFQFTPAPAWAGTLTGVFHAPYGADELYNTTATELEICDNFLDE